MVAMTPDTLASGPPILRPADIPADIAPGPGRRAKQPRSSATLLQVTGWEDQVLERTGSDPRGTYAELFWLPVCGPSALWLLRRLNDGLDAHPDGYVLDPIETAAGLGIGGPGSRHDPLDRAIQRLERFGLVRRSGPATILVRRAVGPVPRHRLDRLPPGLQDRHAAWEVAIPDARALRRRARAVAADMAAIGDAGASIERRLLRAGVHPALAYDAATWATTRWGDLIAG
jgi:hypothetical protein